MRALIDWILRVWLWLALASSAGMLAVAHAFQTFGGLAPCTLCLRQREVYWVALAVCAAALAARRWGATRPLAPLIGGLLALTFAAGCAIAVYHSGAEWKWWPGPTTCASAGGGVNAAEMARLMGGAAVKAPHCDEAPWRFLGLSMAGWNALISLKLAVWSAIWSLWSRRHDG
jgi:disulfide bond formation protein DsbB